MRERNKLGRFKQKYFESNKCIDCEKEIGRYAIRCKSCTNSYYNKLGLRGTKGKHRTEKFKQIMKEKMTGREISEEQRIKIKNTNVEKGLCPPKKFWFKQNHKPWNYRGITSPNRLLRNSEKWKIWRDAVFLRDKFTCQNKKCKYCNNKQGVIIHPHHIKPLALYPELTFDINNGITYCKDFHLKSGLHNGIQKKLRRNKK